MVAAGCYACAGLAASEGKAMYSAALMLALAIGNYFIGGAPRPADSAASKTSTIRQSQPDAIEHITPGHRAHML